MKSKELISIIIPVYKVEDYLGQCVKSVIGQTYTNLEIILVDDGSPDKCPQMCDKFAKKDKRIRVVHQTNGGLSAARNTGLDIATGQYIYFLDSDDYIEPETIETMLKTMRSDDIDIVIAGVKPFYTGKNKPNAFDGKVQYFDTNSQTTNLSGSEVISGPAVAWGKLYKKSIIDKYHLRFDVGLINEDESFNWYYNTKVRRGIFIPNKFYNYLIRNDSIMGNKENKGDKLGDILYIVDNVYNHLIVHKLYKKHKLQFQTWANNIIQCTKHLAQEFNNSKIIEKCDKRYHKYNKKTFSECLWGNDNYKFIEHIFSIKHSKDDKYKVFCILGIKIKFKRYIKSKINIFLTTDTNYLRYVATTVASVCYNTKRNCHFYILVDNISKKNKTTVSKLCKIFKNCYIHWLNLSHKNRQYIVDNFVAKSKNAVYTKNIANYSRFLMPGLLPNIKRALYIDTDLLVWGDIGELYDSNLNDFTIGAIGDSYVLFNKSIQDQAYKYIDNNHLYFNAGVLLIDCEKWRNQNIITKIIESDKQIRDLKLFNSQDPINKCFEQNYQWLPHRFNWFGEYSQMSGNNEIANYVNENLGKDGILIRHFCGNKPDMYPNEYPSEIVDSFVFYARMTPFYDEFVKIIHHIDDPTKIISTRVLPKWFCKLICCFIPNRKMRHKFKDKYMRP